MGISSVIGQWRKVQRAALVERRVAVTPGQRHRWNAKITRHLIEQFPVLQGMLVGLYWPFKGEFDPRVAVRYLRKFGTRAALPVVVQKDEPLQFREWWPGAKMTTDVFNLPVPDGTDVVRSDALLIPLVGFDPQGYRLGYGGGYFDRTLAACKPQPLKIGVAFELSRIPTTHPQGHDVPMDFIVTEAGVHHVHDSRLELVTSPNQVFELACTIIWQRDRAVPQGDIPERESASDPNRPLVHEYSSPACYAHEFDPCYWDK